MCTNRADHVTDNVCYLLTVFERKGQRDAHIHNALQYAIRRGEPFYWRVFPTVIARCKAFRLLLAEPFQFNAAGSAVVNNGFNISVTPVQE